MSKPIKVEIPTSDGGCISGELAPETLAGILRREGWKVEEPEKIIHANINCVSWSARRHPALKCALAIMHGTPGGEWGYAREDLVVIRDFLARAESLLPKEGE